MKPEELGTPLAGPFDLSVDRTAEVQYFHMQTQFIHIGFDGHRTGVETYLLRLRCTPGASSGKSLNEYTCKEFGFAVNDRPIATLPRLRQFSYDFDPMSGVLHAGPFFGIPQEPFVGLKDSLGTELSPEDCYATYNNFVDFHALADVFSRPMKYVKGIETLTRVGDRIVHPGAFTGAPVSLNGVVSPGSSFRNGELTLELKGLSLVDGRPCALVNYDSGESTLRMEFIHKDSENVRMDGGSEYTGDIYLDLASGWVRKVTLNEFVVTETTSGTASTRVPGYTARHILLRLIPRSEFEMEIAVV